MILTLCSSVNSIDEKEIDIPTAESNVEDQDQDLDIEEQEYFVEGNNSQTAIYYFTIC